MHMKVCKKCNVEKELTEFGIVKTGSDRLRTYCKQCSSKLIAEYRIKNSEKISIKSKEHRLKNIEKYKEYDKIRGKKRRIEDAEKIKEYRKEYYLKNKDKIKEYQIKNKRIIKENRNKNKIKRKENEPLYKLRINISNLIYISIKGNGYTKKSRTYEILGCTFEEFKIHLEKQFTEGMSWSNMGKWHLDHIHPVSLAKDEEEIIKLNHYTNFQPLWAIDNIRKSNKI